MEMITNTPLGAISIADLAQDIAQRTNGKPAPGKQPEKAQTAFPLEVLPGKCRQVVREAEGALGIPPDFLGAAILYAAAAAIGNTYALEIKPGSRHFGLIWLCLIGNPNSNKSAALKFAIQPLLDADAEAYERYQTEAGQWKESEPESRTEKPVWAKTVIQDATPEAVAALHFRNRRGIAIFRDEIAGWIKSFNRYNAGGEQEFWLQVWTGSAIAPDRKSDVEPIFVKRAFIPIGGTIQPAVLEELAKDNRTGNGFVDRLLFVWPGGLEKPLWNDSPMPESLTAAYRDGIARLFALGHDEDGKPHVLRLTRDAWAVLKAFFNQDNKPLCDAAESELLAGIYGKFDLHTIRLCLILHMLSWAFSEDETPPAEVQEETAQDAVMLARYFRGQAEKVYSRLHNANPVDKLPKDRQGLYDALPAEFRTAEAVALVEGKGMPERSLKAWLKDRNLFEKLAHGQYAKTL